jgi:hypothetical protein
LVRKTCTAVLFVPNPEPAIFNIPLMAGFCDVGESEAMVGAVAEPSVYWKLNDVSVSDDTMIVTVYVPMLAQAGM